MTILVCGGRAFADYAVLSAVLDEYPTCTHIVHGGATGADSLADRYAREHGILPTPFPADWTNITRPGAIIKYRRNGTPYDAAAGPYRNGVMLAATQPDLVLAFPGGTGTADCVRQAAQRGIPVRRIHEHP